MGFFRDLVDDIITVFTFGGSLRPTLSDVKFDGPRTLAAGDTGEFSVSFKINPSQSLFGTKEGEYEIRLLVDPQRAFPRGGLIPHDTTAWQGEEDIQELFRIAWDSDQVETIDWEVRIQSVSGRGFDNRRGVYAVSISAQ